MALEVEFSRVMRLNSEPPFVPENELVAQELATAHNCVKGEIAELQK